MTPSSDVVVYDGPHAHLAPVLDALCEAMAGAGRRCLRLPSHAALMAEPALLAHAEVIAGFGGKPIGAATLAAAPRLRGLVSSVSGTEGFDLDAATAAGVLVAHAPTPENVRGMAESAVLLLLHLMYDLDGARADLRDNRGYPQPLKARLLQGKTVGLVGWGHISALVASLLQPWGVRLLVSSRRIAPDVPPHAEAVSLETVMASSDAVVVLAGARAGDPPLVDRARLALMKPSAFLVNVARGSLVDEQALVEVLNARRIAGAALDVFATEPLPADSSLRACDNVILTPHHVGHTFEGDASLIPAIIDNVSALLAGRLPPMIRNPEACGAWLERWAPSHQRKDPR